MLKKHYQRTVKFTPPQEAWLTDRAESRGTSVAEEVRSIIDAARTETLHEQKSLQEIERCKDAIRSLSHTIQELIDNLVDEDEEDEVQQ